MKVLLLSLLCHLTISSTAENFPYSFELTVGLKGVERLKHGNSKIKKLAFQVRPHHYPTLTMFEIEAGLEDPKKTKSEKKVIEGILNDFMSLMYGLKAPYTAGQTIIPTGSNLKDVEQAIKDATNRRFKDVYVHIAETYKSGNFTPQWTKNTGWDPQFKPVLVLISSHITGAVKIKYA